MSSRPLPRVRSLVIAPSAQDAASAFALSMLSTHPELGTYMVAATTSEADTVIRSQPSIGFAARDRHARHDDADGDDTSDSVWRRRIVVRGSDKAVPLPWP